MLLKSLLEKLGIFAAVDKNTKKNEDEPTSIQVRLKRVDSAGQLTLVLSPPIAFVPDGWKFLRGDENYKELTEKEVLLL